MSREAGLLSSLTSAGARFERVVLTRNRRVLVSLGDRGRTLRIHACFADAPPEVLRALASMYFARTARSRKAAREVVRDFICGRRDEFSVAAASPRRRQPRSADVEHLARLTREFDRVNAAYFAGSLPRVTIALSGRMRRRNGHFSTHPLEIVIARRLLTDAADGEAEHTLRHEMIHLWQHVAGEKPGHGADFRRWARRLDVHPRATRTVRPLSR